ncbi:hypothetical protein psal_cds_1079 [Pandoravirus salinus]|uniref:F-box incomplete domain containing protein n=1 Tax=Pandoravirus salinus TaxID=1349410 RepID=S4VY44_9VIRU|nr:PRK13679 superfamily incomplete domain [Pandoravirus salinus]AGO85293.1 hypothetical protein psal_cds_1079 [Pandoravirus salinus]
MTRRRTATRVSTEQTDQSAGTSRCVSLAFPVRRDTPPPWRFECALWQTPKKSRQENMATIADLFPKLVGYMLVEFTDSVDRAAAYCVCRLWRRQLAKNRRYAWTCSGRTMWSIARRAIKTGRPLVARWLLDRPAALAHSADAKATLLAAAESLDDDLVVFLRERCQCRWTPTTAEKAIRAGYAQAADQIERDSRDVQPSAGAKARAWQYLVEVDDPDRLMVTCEPDAEITAERMALNACCHGSLRVLDWLRRVHSLTMTPRMVHTAASASQNSADMVAWALTRCDFACGPAELDYISVHASVDALAWLIDHIRNGDPTYDPTYDVLRLEYRLFVKAVECGRLNMAVRGMRDPRLASALTSIRPHITLRLSFIDNEQDADSIVSALDAIGDVVCLRVGAVSFGGAARKGAVRILDWLHRHRTEPVDSRGIADCIVHFGHPRSVAWALDAGYVFGDDALYKAVSLAPPDDRSPRDRREVTKLLAQNGYRWTAKACKVLVHKGDFWTFVDAIDRDGAPWEPESYASKALAHDSAAHRRIAAWIAQRAPFDLGALNRDLVNKRK